MEYEPESFGECLVAFTFDLFHEFSMGIHFVSPFACVFRFCLILGNAIAFDKILSDSKIVGGRTHFGALCVTTHANVRTFNANIGCCACCSVDAVLFLVPQWFYCCAVAALAIHFNVYILFAICLPEIEYSVGCCSQPRAQIDVTIVPTSANSEWVTWR